MVESNGASAPRRAGALRGPDGDVLWRLWAPPAQHVTLVLMDGDDRREMPMQPEPRGYHRHVEEGIPEGQRYAFRLDGGPERPDPCSLWQPEGVHGPSAVVRPDRFAWTDSGWKGVRREDLVFYELHVGTFSPEGTFEASSRGCATSASWASRPSRSCRSASSRATRNWGYDGVLPYAAQDSYGGPQRPADGWWTPAMPRALAIFLDVVYNHFGPEGNYLAEFGRYFNDRYKTPWGAAVNYDGHGCDAVRDYVLDNVRMWLEEFHFDGLRLDAVHAIFDLGARHILRAIEEMAEESARRRGWPAIVIGESDLNDPRLLYPASAAAMAWMPSGRTTSITPSHAFLTGERQGYYADFGEPEQLARALETPFVYRVGLQPVPRPQARRERRGPLGRPLRGLPPEPRPGRQPRPGRPARTAARLAGQAAAGRRVAPAVALPAAAVHGRGVRRGEPVPVLLLVRRPGAGRGGARRAEEGVRRLLLAGRGARPPGRGDLRLGQAELVVARGDAPGGPAPALSRPAGGAARVAGPARLRAPIGSGLLEVRAERPARSWSWSAARTPGEIGAGAVQPRRPAGPAAGDSPAGHRSCSARRPRPTAASVARPGRSTSWPRSSSLSWAPLPGGPSRQ